MYGKCIICFPFLLFILFLGCENEKPNTVWDPNADGKPQPVIESIEPAEGAYAGLQVITISGKNFSSNPNENILTVQGQPGTILSASGTMVTAIPPLVIGDSLTLHLDVIGAYYGVDFKPYNLRSPFNTFGNKKENEFVLDVEFDREGNLYFLVTNDANERILFKQLAGDTSRIEYGRVTVPIGSPSMKFGPDGSLFICRKNNKKFYRIPPGGGASEQYIRLPAKVSTFDFDEDGNIFIGGSGNKIYKIKSDKSYTTVADYDTVEIISLRLFQNYVYVVGQSEMQTPQGLQVFQKIWRNSIVPAADTLGEKELVFDWSSYAGENLISAITFAENGDLYVATDSENPITIIHPDHTASIFLEGILPSPAIGLWWDEGEYIYYINEVTAPPDKQIIQVYSGKNGAPYYGR